MGHCLPFAGSLANVWDCFAGFVSEYCFLRRWLLGGQFFFSEVCRVR